MRAISIVTAAVLIVVAVGVAVSSGLGDIVASPMSSAREVAPAGALVVPVSPHALATAPDGELYLLDSARDQILRRLTDGRFEVVAGNGKRGFSGDGGPAVDAEIHVEYDAGIAVGPNGTVYFADSWNSRVRAILPGGLIETVAGGGTIPLGQQSVPGVWAELGPNFLNPAGLVIGPNGELYMGLDGGVYRLSADGFLHWVVGESFDASALPRNWGGVYSNPAIENDFQPAIRLAFDRSGDLFVAGGGGWGLYVRMRNGTLRFLGTDRQQGGFWASLAETPNGRVIVPEFGFEEVTTSGFTMRSWVSDDALEAALDRALGRLPQPLSSGEDDYTFIVDNVTFDTRGDMFLDDIGPGSGFPARAAVVEVTPTDTVRTLWKA